MGGGGTLGRVTGLPCRSYFHIFTLLLTSSSVSLPFFIRSVPVRKWGEHSCTSCIFLMGSNHTEWYLLCQEAEYSLLRLAKLNYNATCHTVWHVIISLSCVVCAIKLNNTNILLHFCISNICSVVYNPCGRGALWSGGNQRGVWGVIPEA